MNKHDPVARNVFYQKEKRKNGQMEGIQSLNNKRTYIFVYDEDKKVFVGKWIDTPKFNIKEQDEEHK